MLLLPTRNVSEPMPHTPGVVTLHAHVQASAPATASATSWSCAWVAGQIAEAESAAATGDHPGARAETHVVAPELVPPSDASPVPYDEEQAAPTSAMRIAARTIGSYTGRFRGEGT